jgi:hypothetical protein
MSAKRQGELKRIEMKLLRTGDDGDFMWELLSWAAFNCDWDGSFYGGGY